MSIAEQELLEKWRSLPSDKQQQVLEFVEFLYLKRSDQQQILPKTSLGKQLREIRAKIVATGEPLLNRDSIEKEIANRRGGVEKITQ
ncbi:MAG: hypothetical protein HC847_23230 [Hydrococcus sp. RU_2_2]|nr:hypothetical protein [Hydrococcus sp. RU_2_2]NJP21513.1 hypothetical protein [Hydrococcus sp. CRU_1_1]NJQ96912.1 hypothetical protein [Hydrococcus sp. CSU_1_8]